MATESDPGPCRPSEMTDRKFVWAWDPEILKEKEEKEENKEQETDVSEKPVATEGEEKRITEEASCSRQNKFPEEGTSSEKGDTSGGGSAEDSGEGSTEDSGGGSAENPGEEKEAEKELSEEAGDSALEKKLQFLIKGGKWMLFLNKVDRDENGDTQMDREWKKVVKMVERGEVFNANCSTAVDLCGTVGEETEGVICCYTEDYTDTGAAWSAADYIRKEIFLPRPIYYKTEKATNEGRFLITGATHISLYKHTVGGQLFVRKEQVWEMVTDDTVIGEEVGHVEPTTNESHRCMQRRTFEDLVPEVDWKTLGTWVLHRDKNTQDKEGNTDFRIVLREVDGLAELGELYNIAAFPSERCSIGFIYCFTHDYTDTTDVKRAADAIRRVVHIEQPIFYKASFRTMRGMCAWKGDFTISRYMHTQDGRLMVRDGHWKPLIPETAELSTSQPSETQSAIVITAKICRIPTEDKPGKWILFLDRVAKDDKGMTELDRAWVAVKRLVNCDILLDAMCTTAADNPYNLRPNEGAIFCYTRNYADKSDVLKTAEAIRQSVPLSRDILYERVTAVRMEDLKTWNHEDAAIYKHSEDSRLFAKFKSTWVGLKTERQCFEDTGHRVGRRTDIQSADARGRSLETKTGKWVLVRESVEKHGEGASELDCVLVQLEELVKEGVLSSVTRATGDAVEDGVQNAEGAVCCYTRNVEKGEIKRAADSIRKVVQTSSDMYYVLDKSVQRPASIEDGATYRYDGTGRLWQKMFGDWIPV